MTASSDRISWVDYAKGICLVAVVCMYATHHVEAISGARGWMEYWVDFAQPFRMPDFFLISGLFLSRTINTPWREYLDKKVVHFLYFLAVWTTLYFLLREVQAGSNTPDPTLGEYLRLYVEPFYMLWFIAMLPVFFVVTRLVKDVPWMLVFLAAILLQMADINTEFKQLNRFCERFVYFYAGYMFAPAIFRFADWAARNVRQTWVLLGVWAIVNGAFVFGGFSKEPGIALALGFAGAGAVIATGTIFSRVSWMYWLKYLGQNSIVVFLSFFLFMMVAAKIMATVDIVDDVGSRQLLATIAAIAGPIVLFWCVRNTPARYLFARPRWAHIVPVAKAPLERTPPPWRAPVVGRTVRRFGGALRHVGTVIENAAPAAPTSPPPQPDPNDSVRV